MDYLYQFLAVAGVFLIFDIIWLKYVSKKFYQKYLGNMLKKKPDMFAAATFYLIYVLGIVVFALSPALRQGEILWAAGLGTLLGFTMYATYDLTNQATLKNWPRIVTMVDLLWGTIATGATATIVFMIFN